MLRILVLSSLLCGVLSGCGAGSPACTTYLVASVEPAAATVDHAAKAPGDQQQFKAAATYRSSAPGCAVPALSFLEQPNWTVSDPVNVSISSAKDETNGLATCLGATTGPVTLTAGAGGTAGPATAVLTCR